MKYLKWTIISIGVLIILFAVLYFTGRFFIPETIMELPLAQEKQEIAPAIGLPKAAPYFELPDLEGKVVKLSDFRGSALAVVFWTTWNRNASDQIKILDDYLAKNSGGEKSFFKIIAVNSQEDKNAVSNFIRRGAYKVPVLLDENGEITEVYGARVLPAAYFIDKNGTLQDVYFGIAAESTLVDKSAQISR